MMTPFYAFPVQAAVLVMSQMSTVNVQRPASIAAEIMGDVEWLQSN